ATGAPLLELNYPFTHHLVTLRVFPQSTSPEATAERHWFRFEDLAGAAFAAAHLRALRLLLPLEGVDPAILVA
ncbi:MAG: hypothetical protein V4710_08125, partial [Verrucomicrobiota bacterium]